MRTNRCIGERISFSIYIVLFLISAALLVGPAASAEEISEAWKATYDGPGHQADGFYGIAADGLGNVLVTGYSDSSETHDADYDCATLKYTSSGSLAWERR